MNSPLPLCANVGCKCDGSSTQCGGHELLGDSEKRMLTFNGKSCLNCAKKCPSKNMKYREYHFIQCHCSNTELPDHIHIVPRYYCTTKCERLFKKGIYGNPFHNTNTKVVESVSVDNNSITVGSKAVEDTRITNMSCCGCAKIEGDVKFKKCGRCKKAVYCSRQCQVDNWPSH